MVASNSLPATQSALKITGQNEVAVSTTSLPQLEPADVLVRVACVSINPVDGKSADMSPSPGATSGIDFAGVIVAFGNDVDADKLAAENNTSPLKIGDRVFGGVFGNNPLRPDNGAFAEYVAVPARLVWQVPQGMSFNTAASIGATLATVGLSLFSYLKISMPTSTSAINGAGEEGQRPFVLVYGGGTATGAMAIQILKLAGYTPLTTCSSRSAELAIHHGAAATFDYASPTCGSDIREHSEDKLAFALDCITDTKSMAICYEALGSAGGKYVALDFFPLRYHTRRSVQPDFVVTPTQFGQPIAWKAPYNIEPRPYDYECAKDWYIVAQRLLDQGLIEAHPREERKGGLAKVGEGMEAVRRGDNKGKKLVYPIVEELCVV